MAVQQGYTQYLPVSVREVVSWAGWPAVLVVDAGGAGWVVEAVKRWVAEGEREGGGGGEGGKGRGKEGEDVGPAKEAGKGGGGGGGAGRGTILSSISSSPHPPPPLPSPLRPPSPPSFYPSPTDLIVLAACSPTQSLPLHPSLPADLFTCCLTTPIPISLRHFALHYPLLPPHLSPSHFDLIPGSPSDRRSPYGELHWVFTSITDSIAFSSLPLTTFTRLFRQDLLLASLYRNFLLAQRLMRTYGASPLSYPSLPSTHKHPLWDAWDAVQESYVLHLPHYLKTKAPFPHPPSSPTTCTRSTRLWTC